MTVKVADIEKNAKKHGEEYREECFALAVLSQDGLTAEIPDGEFWRIRQKYSFKIGDLIHSFAGPIGKAIHWPCMKGDGTTELKAGSPCDQARKFLNGKT